MRTPPAARGWYAGLLGGLLPILLLGFTYSAVADRTVFALWALVVGAVWILALHRGLSAGLHPFRLLAVLAGVLALGLAAFARLEARHQESLDLGFRTLFPAIDEPTATAPRTAYFLAAAFLFTGLAALTASLRFGAKETT